jgi:hypothetical protein
LTALDRERRAFRFDGAWWLEGDEERAPEAGEVYLAEGRPQRAYQDHNPFEMARILVPAQPDEVHAGIRMSHDQRDCLRAAAAQLEETAGHSEGSGYVDEDPSATLMVASELREIADLYDAAEAKLAQGEQSVEVSPELAQIYTPEYVRAWFKGLDEEQAELRRTGDRALAQAAAVTLNGDRADGFRSLLMHEVFELALRIEGEGPGEGQR